MNNDSHPQYVNRTIEPVLRQRMAAFSAVALTGPRQTGKSTLLTTMLPDHRYLTLDDPFTRQIAQDDPESLFNSGSGPVIIDEVQYAPSILPYIKIRIDQNRSLKGQIILTGSQQFALTKNLSESLAGRVALLELLPFSAVELITCGAMSPNPCDQFEKACLFGLYPEPALSASTSTDTWYSSYLQTYLERDIRTIYDIGSLREFDRLLRLLAGRCSQQLNMTSLSTDIGVSVNTVKRWISILEECRIIFLLQPYYRNLGKRITKAPKVYFTDCGLVCHLTRLRDFDHLMQGPMAGPLFENFCIQEALKAILNTGGIPQLFYLRTQTGLEVDLLVEGSNGKLVPLEFKLSQTPRTDMADNLTSFAVEFADLHAQSGHVVSLSDRRGNISKGAQLLPLSDFATVIAEASS